MVVTGSAPEGARRGREKCHAPGVLEVLEVHGTYNPARKGMFLARFPGSRPEHFSLVPCTWFGGDRCKALPSQLGSMTGKGSAPEGIWFGREKCHAPGVLGVHGTYNPARKGKFLARYPNSRPEHFSLVPCTWFRGDRCKALPSQIGSMIGKGSVAEVAWFGREKCHAPGVLGVMEVHGTYNPA